jgi:hypothetical protein
VLRLGERGFEGALLAGTDGQPGGFEDHGEGYRASCGYPCVRLRGATARTSGSTWPDPASKRRGGASPTSSIGLGSRSVGANRVMLPRTGWRGRWRCMDG